MEPPSVVPAGDGQGLLLFAGEWLLGRGAGADLRLHSDAVSVEHAWIRGDGVTSWIRDADSTNGTFVNARRLAPAEERRLRDGDRIRLGAMTLTYHGPGTHREAGPAPRRPDGAHFTDEGDVAAGTINNAGRDVNNSYDNRRTYDNRRRGGAGGAHGHLSASASASKTPSGITVAPGWSSTSSGPSLTCGGSSRGGRWLAAPTWVRAVLPRSRITGGRQPTPHRAVSDQ